MTMTFEQGIEAAIEVIKTGVFLDGDKRIDHLADEIIAAIRTKYPEALQDEPFPFTVDSPAIKLYAAATFCKPEDVMRIVNEADNIMAETAKSMIIALDGD